VGVTRQQPVVESLTSHLGLMFPYGMSLHTNQSLWENILLLLLELALHSYKLEWSMLFAQGNPVSIFDFGLQLQSSLAP